MATLAELQVRKTNIENAINAILTGGQEYRFNDGQIETLVKKADLATLQRMLTKTENEIENLTESGGFYGS